MVLISNLLKNSVWCEIIPSIVDAPTDAVNYLEVLMFAASI
jgi:hypothetical protein